MEAPDGRDFDANHSGHAGPGIPASGTDGRLYTLDDVAAKTER